MKKFTIVFITLVLAGGHKTYSEELKLNQRHKWGFDFGFGTQKGLDVSYHYEVYLFQYQYYFTLLDMNSWALECIAQPQFNLSRFKLFDKSSLISKGFEYGLNAGLLVRRDFMNEALVPYLFASTGPHYVSGTPERQSPGFIFSDNFFCGLRIRMKESFYLDTRFGFRHISNAGLKNPNGGVNNFAGSIGFLVSFY